LICAFQLKGNISLSFARKGITSRCKNDENKSNSPSLTATEHLEIIEYNYFRVRFPERTLSKFNEIVNKAVGKLQI
jgi:hypothetical protein